MAKFRSRYFNPARIDVRSLVGGAQRVGALHATTARVDVRPAEDVALADFLDDGTERSEGFERPWRVQLGEPEFNPPSIIDTTLSNRGGVDPILARCTWGVDGVMHVATMDWGKGNSFVVTGDFVEVEAIVPSGYTGPAPGVAAYNLTIGPTDLQFLPYAATNGPGYTIGAGADMEVTYNAGAQVVIVGIPAGFYSAATLAAAINADLATFIAPCVTSVSFNNATGRWEWAFTDGGLGNTLAVNVYNPTQQAFAQQLGWYPPYVFGTQLFSDTQAAFPQVAPNTGNSDDIVIIPAGTYTSTALDTLINSQFTSPSATWFFQWVFAGSPTFGLKANMDSNGGGAWYVRDVVIPMTSGGPVTGFLARFGYTAPGRITARADGLALQSDDNVTYTPTYVTTTEAWISLGATIVVDSGELHPEVTRTMLVGPLAAAGGAAMLTIPAYARAFRWHLVNTAVAAQAASSLQFTQTQDSSSISNSVVAVTPLADPKAGGAVAFNTSESSWPSDEGITLVAQARYLWIANLAGAGEVILRIEFILDPV